MKSVGSEIRAAVKADQVLEARNALLQSIKGFGSVSLPSTIIWKEQLGNGNPLTAVCITPHQHKRRLGQTNGSGEKNEKVALEMIYIMDTQSAA